MIDPEKPRRPRSPKGPRIRPRPFSLGAALMTVALLVVMAGGYVIGVMLLAWEMR